MSDVRTQISEEIEKLGKTHHAAIENLELNNQESFKKAADASVVIMEKIQELQAEKKGLADQVLAMEKRIARGMKTNNDFKTDPVMKDYYKAVEEQIRRGRRGVSIDPELFKSAAESIANRNNISVKTVIESSDPDGGFFVHPEFLSERVLRAFQTSPIRQVATIMTTTTNRVEMVIDDNDGTTSIWVAEDTAVPDSATPQIGNLIIVQHKLKVLQDVTLEMIQDSSIDITRWIVDKTTAKQAREQNTAYMIGDGNGKPRGILDYPSRAAGDESTYARETLIHIPSGTSGEFTYDQLTNIQTNLKPEYQAEARWMINRRNWGDILQLKDTQDRPLYTLNNLLQVGATMVLLGKPVLFAEDVVFSVSATPSTNNIIYGEFSGYTIVDRMGINVFVDPFTQAAQDVTRYFVTSRTGGALTSYESLIVGDNT